MADLKPCPFCGASVKLEEEWVNALSTFYSFNCDRCGMYCFQNELVPKDIAIEAWNRRTKVEVNFYDKEETYPNCTVQVLTNTVTGDVSVGWWKNGGNEDG